MSDKKQSLAVAYGMKKRNKRKFAKGGMIGDDMMHTSPDHNTPEIENANLSQGMGHEGDQPADDLHTEKSINEDIVDAIMAKRRFASGGIVMDAGQVDDKFMPINQFSEHGDPNDVDSPGPDNDHEADDQKLISQILKDRKNKRK